MHRPTTEARPSIYYDYKVHQPWLPSAHPARIKAAPRVFSPVATSASPRRILPMLELGALAPNQAATVLAGMSGVIAASARACRVPRSGQVPALVVDSVALITASISAKVAPLLRSSA